MTTPAEPHSTPGAMRHEPEPGPRAVAVPLTPRWIPEGPTIVDAAPSRVYNCALGGMHYFAPDRDLWGQIEELYPPARWAAHTNRDVLARVTAWLTECGVRQFLDIGAGIPVLGATHETVHDLDPTARVVYADIDPIAVEQARDLLRENPRVHAMRGDLLDPHQITDHPSVMSFLDLAEPVAVILGSVLQHLPDDSAAADSISRLTDALSPGSFLIITHATLDTNPDYRRQQEAAYQLYQRTPTPAVLRTADQLASIIDSRFALLPPGIVTADQWQPDPDDQDLQSPDDRPSPAVLVAVARLRPASAPPDNHVANDGEKSSCPR